MICIELENKEQKVRWTHQLHCGFGNPRLTCTEVIWTGGELVGVAGRVAMAPWDWACICANVC